MSKTLIKISGVSKQYLQGNTPVPVLENLNLTIEEGDFLALMGPSGSGKTTLLNLIGGLDQPDSGTIDFDGQCINAFSSSLLTKWRSQQVGFVFQFYNLLPILTARKNVELPLLLTALSGQQRKFRADTALEIVGLAERAEHKPGELSGGQQQRVAIARAIVSDPSLIVCDEPTGDLDRQSADEILNLLQVLNSEHGKTIIMVTHDPKAARYAKHGLYMDKGKLVSEVVSEIVDEAEMAEARQQTIEEPGT
ncbi:MAG: ATP-binding cassette domain-containing protein [Pseudomonadales bacterium]|nr:ATP-binding cassette domain-containing protein [Pseudomonadales bacterium]